MQQLAFKSIFLHISLFFGKIRNPLCELLLLLQMPNKCIMENKDLNRLKIILAEKKIKNKELAKMLGKDQATVSKWCTNSAQPTLENLVEIAKVLNVNVNELIRQQLTTEN